MRVSGRQRQIAADGDQVVEEWFAKGFLGTLMDDPIGIISGVDVRHYFAAWSAMSSGAGRKGYQVVLQARPDFHRVGGRARTALAVRDAAGRFLSGRD